MVDENQFAESPLITLRGKPLNIEVFETPRTPKSMRTNRFNSPRNSPRRSTPSSPKISRLPIRNNARFSIKELRLPPDESVIQNPGGGTVRVTPEKLMEELRTEVKLKKRNKSKAIDEEISLSIPYTDNEILEKVTSDTERISLEVKPRMSMRNRTPVMVNAPDLVYEDPLEVARQTLANTRANTGYKQCKLIYTTEKRATARSSSPEPAFSNKTGITRHFLNLDEEIVETSDRLLKFDRVLKLFADEPRDFTFDLEMKPKKSCLKPAKSKRDDTKVPSQSSTQIIQIKRICYEGDERSEQNNINNSGGGGGSPIKKRRLGSNGAKRLKRND